MLKKFIPFSAFWLRSSVVSVLISLISDTSPIWGLHIKWIFGSWSRNRGLLRPLHASTWYCSVSRNGVLPLLGDCMLLRLIAEGMSLELHEESLHTCGGAAGRAAPSRTLMKRSPLFQSSGSQTSTARLGCHSRLMRPSEVLESLLRS